MEGGGLGFRLSSKSESSDCYCIEGRGFRDGSTQQDSTNPIHFKKTKRGRLNARVPRELLRLLKKTRRSLAARLITRNGPRMLENSSTSGIVVWALASYLRDSGSNFANNTFSVEFAQVHVAGVVKEVLKQFVQEKNNKMLEVSGYGGIASLSGDLSKFVTERPTKGGNETSDTQDVDFSSFGVVNYEDQQNDEEAFKKMLDRLKTPPPLHPFARELTVGEAMEFKRKKRSSYGDMIGAYNLEEELNNKLKFDVEARLKSQKIGERSGHDMPQGVRFDEVQTSDKWPIEEANRLIAMIPDTKDSILSYEID
ncbi:OLC1v1010064C1 [Oldenlandia corymbosa var. corymbosa]|uniref:OLC1v1010064C1 n=1 Tax=Oldenlandia corymbosa var. corymbosa TaxID=529605 RepID=A0AAV1DTP7_OLDCO|nr:OLC1v1010064C1 [Oldenlandia corymbosa var. corymbosa]